MFNLSLLDQLNLVLMVIYIIHMVSGWILMVFYLLLMSHVLLYHMLLMVDWVIMQLELLVLLVFGVIVVQKFTLLKPVQLML